ncbi:MAG: TIR domain-containing protein [Sphingomonas sp.]|nr:TIR domain-containing protein [Sphingomonas sp.]
MNEPEAGSQEDTRASSPVFVSYATANRKRALAVCAAIESRGPRCWISARDVAPGENYQEAIVRSLRDARAVVLVFSKAANGSDEIKKELSLASRFHVPVLTLRIDDVEPSDAFAYELSTRQWVDAFDGWDKSIDVLVGRIDQVSGAKPKGATTTATETRRRWASPLHRGARLTAALGSLLLLIIGGGWWILRTPHAAAHSMTVRMAGFQSLTTDLSTALHETIGAEIIAAFNADGVIGVSTASAPVAGSTPAYALGGTIHRMGDTIRVITKFTNERSGVILWSDSIGYPATEAAKIPHRIAINAATVVRCGLFGASTYRKPLPDSVLGNYLQYCQQYWAYGGNKTLIPAQRVVAAAPDFSWGWSAVANGFMQAFQDEADHRRANDLRNAGLEAEAKALALDPGNSEALAHKAYLIDPHDWIGHETLFKRAIAAKPLDCGCEHFGYGLTLANVGRLKEAADEFRAATDMLALWPDSQQALAQTLVALGQLDDARTHFATAIDLSSDPEHGKWIAANQAVETGDYSAAIAALRDSKLRIPAERRAALLTGYQALASGDAPAKRTAVRALLGVPEEQQNDTVAAMLAALGANREALQIAGDNPSLFWRRSMRGVLRDPAFPDVVTQLGLVKYWKATHTKPDVCTKTSSPPFCRMI